MRCVGVAYILKGAYAIPQTIQIVNECFGVGVVSEAMDGAAPELNPGWVHRRINTCPEVRHARLLF